MYLDFFGLREQPFGVTPDPAYLYLSQTHQQVLDALRSDLESDRGFMALVGDPGLGKTTLMYKLLHEWAFTSRAVLLFQTQCNSREFFEYLLTELGVNSETLGLVEMHQKLNDILFQEMLSGRRFILIVDEAHNLDNSVLETVRLLSNFETEHAKLMNIVLVGQSQLADKLSAPGLRQLRQRIGFLNRLRPLTAAETEGYINHRLCLAGHSGDAIFTPGAVRAIARASHGAPREINHICHHALSAAALNGVSTINLDIVENIIAGLEGISIETQPLPVGTPEMVLPQVQGRKPVFISTPTPLQPTRPSSPVGAPLSYGSPRKAKRIRRVSPAVAACALLLVGFAYAIPSVRNFAKREYRDLTSNFLALWTNSGTASASEYLPSIQTTVPASDPDFQDGQSNQIITVSSKAGQTIEELSRLYAGHFDNQLYLQIRGLNPDLKAPNNLDGGELIRLPLPPGTLKRAVDTDDPHNAIAQGKWQTAVSKVKDLFFNK